jgi:hypothetical protein
VAAVQCTFTHKQYTEQQKTIHRTTQKLIGTVRAVLRLGELYPGICLTTEEKARKTLSQGNKFLPIFSTCDITFGRHWPNKHERDSDVNL